MIIIRGGSVIYSRTSILQYIRSKNNLTSGGFTIGVSVNKDMTSGPRVYVPAIYPGTAAPTGNSSYWLDWLGDIFDQWGFFYLYDNTSNTYLNVVFSTINQPDGVISTQTFSLAGRTFTINHGYAVQGIYKIDVSVSDDLNFIIGMNGNMGSDNSTINNNLSEAFSLNGENFNLYYNQNMQNGSSTERLYTYFVPYEKDKNKSTTTFSKLVGGNDNLSMYSVSCKRGILLYFAKTNDVKNWIINDLTIQ